LRIIEQEHSGNRSPFETGQYSVSQNRYVIFKPGQERARSTITMTSDPLREADMDVRLTVLDDRYRDTELAAIELRLEDDDQRAFEDNLRPNTVSFAVSQVSVREQEAAVQVDVIRHKADGTSMDVVYVIRDVTATEGEDYFDPGSNLLTFEPWQRTGRILIPLVQDSAVEGDEAFQLEIIDAAPTADRNIYRRIAVMIRDDDT
jgi:hypothetical protein